MSCVHGGMLVARRLVNLPSCGPSNCACRPLSGRHMACRPGVAIMLGLLAVLTGTPYAQVRLYCLDGLPY